MPSRTFRLFRRPAGGYAPPRRPGVVLCCALLSVLACYGAALADQTNPQGTVISGKNPGMQATVSNERVINLGGIVASSSDIAVGMGYPLGPLIYGVSLRNAGVIHATGGVAANGMYGPTDAILRNTGSIAATGNVTANGIYGGDYSVLDNAGSITVSGGNAGGLTGQSHARLRNSGVISAASASGLANGMSALLDSNIINTGSITATALNGNAYGMFLQSGAAANYGLIRLSASNGVAYELVAQTGSVQVIDWALDLQERPNRKSCPFLATDGGQIDFTGARLILRPGAASQGFALGREYDFSSLLATYNGGSMAGSPSSVTSELPELLEARLRPTAVGTQKISLHARVNAHTNPGQAAAAQAVGNARSGMSRLNSVLAGQLSPLTPGNRTDQSRLSGDAHAPETLSPPEAGRWQVFGAPYFSSAVNHDLDYTSNSVGFVMGGTYRFNEQFAAGLHLGYSGARAWGDLMAMDNAARTGLLGLHGVFNLTPEWYLRGQFTGFISHYENACQSGVAENPLEADADFNGHGLYASLNSGYAWQINENNILTPELGLSWLWSRQDASTLHWSDSVGFARPVYDMAFDAQDYTALYGTALLRWRGDFAPGGGKGGNLRPALGLGLRQTLSSGEVESRMRFLGSAFSTGVTEDPTVMLAEAGLEWQCGGFAAGLTYTGEYGAQQEAHAGWLTMKFEF